MGLGDIRKKEVAESRHPRPDSRGDKQYHQGSPFFSVPHTAVDPGQAGRKLG
jgi:hypothetical protein